MYVAGEGAPRDLIEGYKWMHLAAEAGLSEGIAARARLAALLDIAEIRQAMERAEAWKRANDIR